MSWLLDDMPYDPFLPLRFQKSLFFKFPSANSKTIDLCYFTLSNVAFFSTGCCVGWMCWCVRVEEVAVAAWACRWRWLLLLSTAGDWGFPGGWKFCRICWSFKKSDHMNIPTELKDFVCNFLCWKYPKVFRCKGRESRAFIPLTCCPWEDWISWATAAKASEVWSWGTAAAAEFAVDPGWASCSLTGDCGDAAETHW